MKKIAYFILAAIVFLSSCSNKNINEHQAKPASSDNDIKTLQKENLELRNEILALKEQLKPIDFTFCDYTYKYRLIKNEVRTCQLPKENFLLQYTLVPNKVVFVESAANDSNGVLWLYVSWQMEAYTVKGWIKESDTSIITKDNIKKAGGSIIIKKGSLVYKIREFEEISKTKSEILTDDLNNGTFIDKKGNYILVSFPVGLDIIVDEKYITYRKYD